MKKKKLKPCPFCGGEKHTICRTDYDYDNKDAYAVSCRYHNCHGSIFSLGYGYFATKDEAIAAWNTRAIDPAAIREAALREAAAVVHKWWFDDGNELPQELILALIGEKK
jgi:Lar family restriction alleviation protein